jgi:hypothetical protein
MKTISVFIHNKNCLIIDLSLKRLRAITKNYLNTKNKKGLGALFKII